MRTLLLVFALALTVVALPPPAAAVLCHPNQAMNDPVGYVHCQFGCEVGAVHRFAADPRVDNLFIACPA